MGKKTGKFRESKNSPTSRGSSRGKIKTVGVVQRNRRGFGFVTTNLSKDDIFVPIEDMNGAMNQDTVEIQVTDSLRFRRKSKGRILKIIKRYHRNVVGTYYKGNNQGIVVPLDPSLSEELIIDKGKEGGAENGDKVVAEIIAYASPGKNSLVRVIEILGKKGEMTGLVKAMVVEQEIPTDFPVDVFDMADRLSHEGISVKEVEGRKDLRDRMIVTIDGVDSKDFDDGVSCYVMENGNYHLGIHIADVAHYVTEGSIIDKEGLKRGNSVYLPDRVVPMLPRSLSNGICSLNPGEDRLTITIDMEIDLTGKVVGEKIYESIIRSKERLVYEDISDILEDKNQRLTKKYSHIHKMIIDMGDLSRLLSQERYERGSLDFDLKDANFVLDYQGNPVEIVVKESRLANKLIEEFMVLANERIAKTFFDKEAPFVYRVHDKPDREKLAELIVVMQRLGIPISKSARGGQADSKDLQIALEHAKRQTYENMINRVILRSMQKAVYSTECRGHFGLSLEYYCHFTSPIRRYSDLIIHRIIKKYLKEVPSKGEVKRFKKATEVAAQHCTMTERRTVELERKVEKVMKAKYMVNHIGEEFESIISGITEFGIYVSLPNTVEGMVKKETMKEDDYVVDVGKHKMVSEGSGKVLALGDTAQVQLEHVDVEKGEIDFILI